MFTFTPSICLENVSKHSTRNTKAKKGDIFMQTLIQSYNYCYNSGRVCPKTLHACQNRNLHSILVSNSVVNLHVWILFVLICTLKFLFEDAAS